MNPNSSEPAFPFVHSYPVSDYVAAPGLTKREYFAATALQGLITTQTSLANNYPGEKFCAIMADGAVKLADALLAALKETK